MKTRRLLMDLAPAAWVVLVLARFLGPFFGMTEVALVEDYGLHVLLLGVCLAMAAIDGALAAVRHDRVA